MPGASYGTSGYSRGGDPMIRRKTVEIATRLLHFLTGGIIAGHVATFSVAIVARSSTLATFGVPQRRLAVRRQERFTFAADAERR
jgi:hypothetical protein